MEDNKNMEFLITVIIIPLMIGVIGSVISSIICSFVTIKINNRTNTLVQCLQLRNILYNAENEILNGNNIDRHQWMYWHSQIDVVRTALDVLCFHSYIFDKEIYDLFFHKSKIAENHFRSIDSIIYKSAKYKHLGLIEFATETRNLIRQAELNKELVKLIKLHREYMEYILRSVKKRGLFFLLTSWKITHKVFTQRLDNKTP